MTRLGHDIEDEIRELICEILEIESFELTPTKPFLLLGPGDVDCRHKIRTTLECAFGVVIERADVVMMEDLQGVCAVLEAALAAKHAVREAA